MVAPAAFATGYFFLPPAGADLAPPSEKGDPVGAGLDFACFGFLASRLLRC